MASVYGRREDFLPDRRASRGASAYRCKKLKGGRDEWRIRVGDYRVVYSIEDSKLRISVVRVRHRKDVYEG